MRAQRAVRATALTEAPLFRNCASRPRFLCLNASRPSGASVRGGIANGTSRRWLSETRLVRAGAAEAVYVFYFVMTDFLERVWREKEGCGKLCWLFCKYSTDGLLLG